MNEPRMECLENFTQKTNLLNKHLKTNEIGIKMNDDTKNEGIQMFTERPKNGSLTNNEQVK